MKEDEKKLLKAAHKLIGAIRNREATPIKCEDDQAYADYYLREAVREFFIESTGENPWELK